MSWQAWFSHSTSFNEFLIHGACSFDLLKIILFCIYNLPPHSFLFTTDLFITVLSFANEYFLKKESTRDEFYQELKVY